MNAFNQRQWNLIALFSRRFDKKEQKWPRQHPVTNELSRNKVYKLLLLWLVAFCAYGEADAVNNGKLNICTAFSFSLFNHNPITFTDCHNFHGRIIPSFVAVIAVLLFICVWTELSVCTRNRYSIVYLPFYIRSNKRAACVRLLFAQSVKPTAYGGNWEWQYLSLSPLFSFFARRHRFA